MKMRILKITAAFMSALFLFTLFPISEAAVNAADHDQELREFVTRLYSVCLKRDPDEGGLEYWVDELKTKKETGVACASGFIFSPELQEKDYSNEDYAKVMYDAFFGREADSDGLSYWTQKMSDGMTRQEVFTGFANSQEFFDLCESFDIVAGTFIPGFDPSKVSSTNFFAERLYNVVLGRKCDRDGMMYWTTELLNGRISGTAAAYGFFFSPEYADSKKHYSEYVNDLYNALMGREADEDGRTYWVNAINTGSTKEQVFNGFAMSPEFSDICSNYGILQGTTVSEENDTTYTLLPDDDSSVTTPKPTKAPTTKPSNNKATPTTKPVTNTTTTKPTTDPSATKTPAATVTPTLEPAISPSITPETGIKIVPVNTDLKIRNANMKIMSGCSDQILFVDGDNNTVMVDGATFTSSNEEVAYVCPDGTVVGLSEGSAVITVSYGGTSSCVYVSVEKYISTVDSIPNALTPQQFGAVGNGKHDDTQAFKDMFTYAWEHGYYINPSQPNGFRKCKTIFIPGGHYLITDSIIEKESPIEWAAFEVYGAGRESTTIHFTGSVLFDNQTYATLGSDGKYGGPVHFAFSTFRDIGFEGNYNNTFMNISDNHSDKNGNHISNTKNPNGVQRLQFISCGFSHCKEIIHTVRSYQMLSEITFAYCKINDCGTKSDEQNYCRLFTLNNSESVDWRFVSTDIEGIYGDIFYYERGASVYISDCSIIVMKGTAFNFNLDTDEKAGSAGPSNSPHLYCEDVHFEMKYDTNEGWYGQLLKTNCVSEGTPKIVFDSCKMGTMANRPPHYLCLNGAADIRFDNCYDLSNIKVYYDFKLHRTVRPHLTFTNCTDLNVDNLVHEATIVINDAIKIDGETINVNGLGWNETNNVRVSVDDSYDFYLYDYKTSGKENYLNTVMGLNLCRQEIKINNFGLTTLSNGRIIDNIKPYGQVDQVELYIPDYNAGDITVTILDNGKVIGQTVLKSGTEKYQIHVGKYVDNLQIKFTHNLSKSPDVKMNLTIVKY